MIIKQIPNIRLIQIYIVLYSVMRLSTEGENLEGKELVQETRCESDEIKRGQTGSTQKGRVMYLVLTRFLKRALLEGEK